MALMNCPECDAEISDQADNCPVCGYPIKGKKVEMKICPECNKEMPKKDKVCSNCGATVKNKVNKKIFVAIAAACIVAIIGGGVAIYINKLPEIRYNKGVEAFANGNYQEAEELFNAAAGFSDSAYQAKVSAQANSYTKAVESYNSGAYIQAVQLFEESEMYNDSKTYIQRSAEKLIEFGQLDDGLAIFEKYADDSNEYYHYALGRKAIDNSEYSNAISQFERAGEVCDAEDQLKKAIYSYGKSLFDKKDYENALTQFNKVTDYEDASTMANASSLMMAEAQYKAGKLKDAQAAYKKLPNGFSYNGVSVKDRLDTLSQYSDFVNLCGTWKMNSGGSGSSRQTSKSYGSWDQWDFTWNASSSYYVEITCTIGSGNITIKGNGVFPRAANYSSLSSLINTKDESFSFSKSMSSFSKTNIDVNSNTKMTLEKNKITIDYSMTDSSESAYFKYTYKTKVTYSK